MEREGERGERGERKRESEGGRERGRESGGGGKKEGERGREGGGVAGGGGREEGVNTEYLRADQSLNSELYYTRIKILCSYLFLQFVPANLHANRLHMKQ